MYNKIPSPLELGLPRQFTEWRDSQESMLLDVANSEKRFQGVAAPTGIGKSLFAVALQRLTKERVVIATRTKGLQHQYMRDFAQSGLVNIMGKANYQCDGGLDDWTCEKGSHGRCMFVGTPGCASSSAYFTALSSNLVITNYAYLIAAQQYGVGIGQIDRLILDEGHEVYGAIADAMQVRLSKHEVKLMLKSGWPTINNDLSEWKAWAGRHKPSCDSILREWETKVSRTPNPPTSWVENVHHYSNLSKKLATLMLMRPDSWTVEGTDEGYILDPIRIAPYAERVLYKGVPKVTFLSASIRPKSMWMCGVKGSEMEFFQYASPFPTDNSPVYHVPIANIKQGSEEQDYVEMVRGIDNFLRVRQDRKGLIFCNSYRLTNMIRERSKFQRTMMFNREGDNIDAAVERFKKMPAPYAFISPSVATGYNFPGAEAEYMVIPKVPFPDRSHPIVVARECVDREYTAHHTMQLMDQAAGRPRRQHSDRCETIIMDENMSWFWRRYSYLATPDFHNRYQSMSFLPKPITRVVQ
jgi:Rad3-related DNA helicase